MSRHNDYDLPTYWTTVFSDKLLLNITLSDKSSPFHPCNFCVLVTLLQAWQHWMAALALEACLMAQETPWRHWARPTQASNSMLPLLCPACTTRACSPSRVSQQQAAKRKVGSLGWEKKKGCRQYRWSEHRYNWGLFSYCKWAFFKIFLSSVQFSPIWIQIDKKNNLKSCLPICEFRLFLLMCLLFSLGCHRWYVFWILNKCFE